MPLLLAFLVAWSPVTHDCRGGLESVPPVYEIWTYRAEVIGSMPGPDGEPVPLYSRLEREELTLGTSLPIPDPAVGGVVAWGEPVAVDLDGNRSDVGCP